MKAILFSLLAMIVLTSCGSGCGGPSRWETLPVGFRMIEGEVDLSKLNPETKERVDAAVEYVNETLGDVFTEGDRIDVQCVIKPIDGNVLSLANCSYDSSDGIITHALIRIKCYYWLNEPFDRMRNAIIHELWHCLGFDYHYDNPACIGANPISDDPADSEICPEMIDDFYEKYPEMKK